MYNIIADMNIKIRNDEKYMKFYYQRRKRIDDLFIDVLTDTITEKDFRNRLEKTELFLEENVIVAIIHQCLAENGKDIKWKEFCDGVTYSSPINTN